MLITLTRQTIHTHILKDKNEIDHKLFEGEVQMDQQQQDYYQQLVGDGKASVTVSRELSESSFGSGGKLFVSITLTCNQSQSYLEAAINFAKTLAEQKAWEQHGELRTQLIQRGLLKP